MKALLMLENGMTFEGHGFGEERDVACEVVFNSAMCGYPELLTDPSYAGQGVVMTYPMIGNYGICIEDAESCKPWLSAFIVHGVSGLASNFRCDMDLDSYLKNNHIPGMYGIDTRALTRVLRESGTMKGMIAYGDNPRFGPDEKNHRRIPHGFLRTAGQCSEWPCIWRWARAHCAARLRREAEYHPLPGTAGLHRQMLRP